MKVIPEKTWRAANAAFIRTAAQSVAGAALFTGTIVFALTEEFLAATLIAIGGTIFQAVFAGGQAWFAMLAKGIPEVYTDDVSK